MLDRDVALILLSLIESLLRSVLRRCNERVDFVQMLLLIQEDTSFEDFIVRCRNVRDSRVDDNFLVTLKELLWLNEIVRIEVLAVDIVVNLEFFFAILGNSESTVCDTFTI